MSATSEPFTFPGSLGHTLAGRLERPSERPRAVAIFAHCFTCSKDIAAASRISRALGRRGFAVLRFDFTGLGNSDGDFANTHFSSNVADLVAAADALREAVGAPRLLVGHSLGGAAVLVAAARIPEVAAVVTIAAPADPVHVEHLLQDQLAAIERDGEAEVALGGRRFTIRREFLADLREQDHQQTLQRLGKPVLVMHSPVDEVVGIDQAARIYRALQHPKSLVSLADADHLLSRKADSEYAAEVLAAWSSRYVPAEDTELAAERPADGVVRVVSDGSKFGQSITTSRHGWVADEPAAAGGDDTGPTPYGLLLSALGACTNMTLLMYARHKGIALDGVRTDLRHDRIHAEDCDDCATKEGHVDRIERVVHLVGDLDAKTRARMIEIANRCPVHRTLTGEIKVVTREGQAEPPATLPG